MSRRSAWMICLLSACGGTVTQDPPQDPTTIPDASVDASSDASGDAPDDPDAGALLVGLPCASSSDCGSTDYSCHPGAPGGYCSYYCSADAECPTGSVCSPVPFSRISGICMKTCTNTNECRAGYACAVVSLFPGQPNSPSSSSPVCWTAQDAGP